ncbi:hypothetical protein ABKN59_007721 [Abortiporus biennis]
MVHLWHAECHHQYPSLRPTHPFTNFLMSSKSFSPYTLPAPRLRNVPLPPLVLDDHKSELQAASTDLEQKKSVQALPSISPPFSIAPELSYSTRSLPMPWCINLAPTQSIHPTLFNKPATRPAVPTLHVHYPFGLPARVHIIGGRTSIGSGDSITLGDVVSHIHEHLRSSVTKDEVRRFTVADQDLYDAATTRVQPRPANASVHDFTSIILCCRR